MAEYSIRVRVQGRTVSVRKEGLNARFTVADVRNACPDYDIPTDNGVFRRSGVKLADDAEVRNNDFLTLEFPKGGGGRR